MSSKYELAGGIATSLLAGERSLNQAAIDLFAVGTAVMSARNSGEFHPLESQREVERLKTALDNVFSATGEIARIHDKLWIQARDLGVVTGQGVVCPWGDSDDPTGHVGNVVPIAVA